MKTIKEKFVLEIIGVLFCTYTMNRFHENGLLMNSKKITRQVIGT